MTDQELIQKIKEVIWQWVERQVRKDIKESQYKQNLAHLSDYRQDKNRTGLIRG